MARRSKIRSEQIRASLFTTCTECGQQIYPAELRYVDGKRCRCPQCGAEFEPVQKGYAGGGLHRSPAALVHSAIKGKTTLWGP
jgi:hypothetical protein